MIFEGNWASPPGDTISRLAAERNISTHDVASALGFEDDLLVSLMEGRTRISEDIARILSAELGATSRFWISRYEQFVADRARLDAQSPVANRQEWPKSFPLRSMRDLGWLRKGTRGQVLTDDILEFFGCKSIPEWNQKYSSGIGQVAFRTSFAFDANECSTLSWLRAGEIQCDGGLLPRYDAASFRESLPDLKKLCAYKHPELFFPKLQRACAEFGIFLVSARCPAGCRASGATWTAATGNPVIMVSFRFLTDDHFWFTFFHEAGHVVLAGTDHIDVDGADPAPLCQSHREHEADEFAQNMLLPYELREALSGRALTRRNVRAVAREAGVTPGIVVGQLQKAGVLAHNQFNDLKRRYIWGDNFKIPTLSQPRKYS